MATLSKTVKPKNPPAKIARSLGSKSKLLEAAHNNFVSWVIANKIQSITVHEDDEARYITLAEKQRLRCDKKSRILSTEQFVAAPDGYEWQNSTSSVITHFWHTNAELISTFQHAWYRQLDEFVPSQDKCYPVVNRNTSNNRSIMLARAAERRLGGAERKKIALRMFTKALWNFLVDREALRLCHAVFGRKASLSDYNFTVRREKDLRARAAETPNLTRLMGAYIRITPEFRSGRKKLPLDLLAQAKLELFKPMRSAQAGCWVDPNSCQPFPPQALSPAGWRYITTLSGPTLEQLWSVAQWDRTVNELKGQSPGPVLATAMNHLARTGEHPPATFIKWAVHTLPDWTIRAVTPEVLTHLQECALRLLRLAGQQANLAKKKGNLKRFVKGDLLLVWDWFRKQGQDNGFDGNCLTISKNATWASLMRAQHEWHAQRAERDRARRAANAREHAAWQAQQDSVVWDSALEACEVNDTRVTPLTTGLALRTEGSEMDHCVGGYVPACKSNRTRIFALEHKGKRATVELALANKNTWRVRQVFGPRNSPVSKALEKTAQQLAVLYAQANQTQLAQAA